MNNTTQKTSSSTSFDVRGDGHTAAASPVTIDGIMRSSGTVASFGVHRRPLFLRRKGRRNCSVSDTSAHRPAAPATAAGATHPLAVAAAVGGGDGVGIGDDAKNLALSDDARVAFSWPVSTDVGDDVDDDAAATATSSANGSIFRVPE